MNGRRCLLPLACALLFATTTAAAAQGTIVLTSGEVIAGDIYEVVKGDYVLIKLPNGELRAYAWDGIQTVTINEAPAVVPPPPRFVVVPPPPPPFESTVTLGARVGTMVAAGNVYGDDYDHYDHYRYDDHGRGPALRMSDVASWGYLVEGDLGYHFSPSWTVYGFWEHGGLDRGDFNRSWGNTNAVGLGVNVNTSPDRPFGLYFDLGACYRWMQFTDATTDPNAAVVTRTTAEGFDYLRAAFGASITLSRKFRLDPHIYSSSGYFTRFSGNGCAGCAFDANHVDSGLHWFSGLAVAARYDL